MLFERNIFLVALALALLAPLALQNDYALHIGVLIMFSAMLATSFNLIVGYVGEFPLGHTAFLGIGAYTAALLSIRFGLPFHVTVIAAALVAALSGLFIGAVTLRLRGPFFVIVTLCFAEVLRLVANNWVALTNGPMGISGIAKPECRSTTWAFFWLLLLSTFPTALSILMSAAPRSRFARTVSSRNPSAFGRFISALLPSC
jgi:branched-chain amino acid transport system permease protein